MSVYLFLSHYHPFVKIIALVLNSTFQLQNIVSFWNIFISLLTCCLFKDKMTLGYKRIKKAHCLQLICTCICMNIEM